MNRSVSLQPTLSITWLTDEIEPNITIPRLKLKVLATIINAKVVIVPDADDFRHFCKFSVTLCILCHLKTFFDIFGVHWTEVFWVINVSNVTEPYKDIRPLLIYSFKYIRIVRKKTVARAKGYFERTAFIVCEIDMLRLSKS